MDINGAGASASDPLMEGLEVSFAFGDRGMQLTVIDQVYLDDDPNFPGTNDVKLLLSPSASKTNSGTCNYNNVSNLLEGIDTTDLGAGDVLYLSHSNITDGLYQILSIADGTKLALNPDPFYGLGHAFSVNYQFGWRYSETLGSGFAVSSPTGHRNWFKLSAQNVNAQSVITTGDFYLADAPTNADLLSLNGADHNLGATNLPDIALQIVPAWASKGGVSHVRLVNHTQQGRNDFTWTAAFDQNADVAVAQAETSGLSVSAPDGMKYGALAFKTRLDGSGDFIVDFSIRYDTTGPGVTLTAIGS